MRPVSNFLIMQLSNSREYGVDFLNASDYAEASETDAIHLDAENHRRLAEGFAEKIREIHRRMEQQQGSGTKK